MQSGTFEFQRKHILIIGVMVISFSTAFIMRSYPSKYGFYLHEYDPYFNYRATKYILDHGLNAYLKWHDTMSWYPEGRDVAKTSQSGLHIVTAFLYVIFGRGVSLIDFTIILPVVLSSLTTILFFLVVRMISNTPTGLFAALLLAVSPPVVVRGSFGWFKSEPLGLFLGLLATYLFLSSIKEKKMKYCIPKAVFGGLVLGLGNASWNGVQYFALPLSLFLFIFPLIRKNSNWSNTKLTMYSAITFTIFAIVSTVTFPRSGISSSFDLSSIGLAGGTLFFIISNLVKKFSHNQTKRRNVFFLLIIFVVAALAIVSSRLYYLPDEKYLGALIPFFDYSPFLESVAEHEHPSITDYVRNFSTLLIFAVIGAWFSIKNCKNSLAKFALIIGLSGIYVSTSYVRLSVFASIGIITLAAFGLNWITTILLEPKETFTRSAAMMTTSRIADRSVFSKLRQGKLNNNEAIIKSASIALIILLLVFPMAFPQGSNWISYSDIPPPIINGDTGYHVKIPDWINALTWISKNTNKNAVIAAWWDYGYWITTMGNRITVADNAANNKTRIETLSKMLMERPEEGVKIAHDLKANYLLIYIVAQRVKINGNLHYYILGNGGDESKIFTIAKLANFDVNKYLEPDQFTPKPVFWNNTLLGKLVPFSPKGYIYTRSGELLANNNNIFKVYKPASEAIYSMDIKYPQPSAGNNNKVHNLSLTYASDSLTKGRQSIISAVLIYKINSN